MKRFILSAIVFVLLCTQAFAADVTGTWKGALYAGDDSPTPILIVARQHGGELTGWLQIPDWLDSGCEFYGTIVGKRVIISTSLTHRWDIPILLDFFVFGKNAAGSYCVPNAAMLTGSVVLRRKK